MQNFARFMQHLPVFGQDLAKIYANKLEFWQAWASVLGKFALLQTDLGNVAFAQILKGMLFLTSLFKFSNTLHFFEYLVLFHAKFA